MADTEQNDVSDALNYQEWFDKSLHVTGQLELPPLEEEPNAVTV